LYPLPGVSHEALKPFSSIKIWPGEQLLHTQVPNNNVASWSNFHPTRIKLCFGL